MQDFIHFVMAHWLLFLLLLAVLVALLRLEWEEGAVGAGPMKVSPEQAVTLINHEQAVIVDMRAAEEYTKAHILAAISVPLAKLDAQLGSLKKYATKPIILYGLSAKHFVAVKESLAKKGLQNVFHLFGGLNAWRDAGMPLEKREEKNG